MLTETVRVQLFGDHYATTRRKERKGRQHELVSLFQSASQCMHRAEVYQNTCIPSINSCRVNCSKLSIWKYHVLSVVFSDPRLGDVEPLLLSSPPVLPSYTYCLHGTEWQTAVSVIDWWNTVVSIDGTVACQQVVQHFHGPPVAYIDMMLAYRLMAQLHASR